MKYAVVTGATKGIGRAIAEGLLNKGYYVFVNYASDESAAAQARNALEQQWNGRFSFCRADLSTMEGMECLAAAVERVTPQLHCLVLNAGVTDRSTFGEITAENWNRVMDTNLNIPFFLIQRLSGNLAEQARIIMIGSMMGIHPHSTSLAYGISKAGLHFLAQSLVKCFEGRSITVNVIAPGFVETPWQADKPAEIRRNIENKVAAHRFAQPREVAALCEHIIENEYLNGAVICLDGGYDYR